MDDQHRPAPSPAGADERAAARGAYIARRLREQEAEARALGAMSMMQLASAAPGVFADAMAVMAEAVDYIGARRDG